MARNPVPIGKRLLAKFLVGDGCWEWTASMNRLGYGQIWSMAARRPIPAHRAVYELLVGPIPEGLHIDHLCRNPSCVRPDHLEPVVQAENTRRGMAGEVHRAQCALQTRCKWGHEFTPENTYMGQNANGNPRRVCRACRAARERKRLATVRSRR